MLHVVADVVDRWKKGEMRDGVNIRRGATSSEPDDPVGSSEPGDPVGEEKATNNPGLHRLNSSTSYLPFVARGKAFRRNKESKWKPCFIMLSDMNGPELYVFDRDKQRKPRQVYELICCFFCVVDASIAGRSNCFCVVLNWSGVRSSLHIAVEQYAQYLEWIFLLRPRCLARNSCAPLSLVSPFVVDFNGVRVSSFIYLALRNYRGPYVKLGSKYYTVVLVNGTSVRRTQSTMPSANGTVVFDALYLLEDIPFGSCVVQLELWAQSDSQAIVSLPMVKNKSTCVREVTTEFTLRDDESELCACGAVSLYGFVFRAVRHQVVVLPEEQYSPFLALLTSRDFLLPRWVGSVMNEFNRDYFFQLLLPLFLSSDSVYLSFLDTLLEAQLENEEEASLFRRNSYCTRFILVAMRVLGHDVFVEEMAKVMRPFHSDRVISFDSDDFCKALWTMCPQLPPIFIATLSRVAHAASARFPESARHASLCAINNFFMLRFVNPVLLMWDGLGPSAKLLAKSVQLTANQVCHCNFNPESASRGSLCMAKVFDHFLQPPKLPEDAPNAYSYYRKGEHLALLAFLMSRTIEQRPADCPVPEALSVIRCLNAYGEQFVNFT